MTIYNDWFLTLNNQFTINCHQSRLLSISCLFNHKSDLMKRLLKRLCSIQNCSTVIKTMCIQVKQSPHMYALIWDDESWWPYIIISYHELLPSFLWTVYSSLSLDHAPKIYIVKGHISYCQSIEEKLKKSFLLISILDLKYWAHSVHRTLCRWEWGQKKRDMLGHIHLVNTDICCLFYSISNIVLIFQQLLWDTELGLDWTEKISLWAVPKIFI